MADAAVELLLNNLENLQQCHNNLIADNKSQIDSLGEHLKTLRDSLKSRRKDEITQVFVKNIRDVVYEAEDTIDAFVTQSMEKRPWSSLHKFLKSPPNTPYLHDIIKKVEMAYANIKNEVDILTDDKQDNYEKPKVSPNFVGFEEETSEVIGYLTEETDFLDVITLVGKPGIGKTTLAQKIFTHPDTESEFPTTRIWVRVSDELRKNVFLSILKKFIRITEDVMNRSEEDLKQEVVSSLKSSKYLIVFDDVWSVSDWESLQIALPEHNNQGKVLITSCNEKVGRRASRNRGPHKVRKMSEGESWELLQLEVFGETKCPPELETVGKLISKECDGLPLAIMAVGDVLLREDLASVDIKARKAAWMRACRAVPKYRYKKLYDSLPTHLQVCLLYLAAFPYDFEIPVGRLICMWIAEGFVGQRDGFSLEETGERYLEALISRSLLNIGKYKANGRVKTCSINCTLHEFCKTEASYQGENLFTEINYRNGVFEPPISDLLQCRRLSIHSNIIDFISSKPSIPHVRSLVSFSKEDIFLPTENSSAIRLAFKLLRVVDVEPIKFNKMSSDMYHLVHLRYLVFSSNLSVLPKIFSKLWNIQTLLVNTTSPTLDIKADIFKLTKLRHFKTNASASLIKPGEVSESGEKLQSLGTVSAECCTEELFNRARNLKKLGIRGRLSLLFNGKTGSIDKLAALVSLENLKLLYDVSPRPTSEGRLRGLTKDTKFPPNLRSLTLANTYLAWDQMSILGLLEKLEVLKLKDKAFMGRIWEAEDEGFRSLEALHIEETDLSIWVASARHFPRLESLKLCHCEELQEVPIELAEIPSLRLLELFESRLATASAKRFQQKKEKCLKESSTDAKEFMLSIYPPS